MSGTSSAAKRSFRLLCYGDSNTFGHDPRLPIGAQYPPEQRWTGRLAQIGWGVENLGLNGRQIPASSAELSCAAAQIRSHFPADFVLIMLGTNDLLWNPGFCAEDAAQRMVNFLCYLLPEIGQTIPVLLSPPAMCAGTWVAEPRLITESARLGALYAAVARQLGIAFADTAAWALELAFDGIHLSENGHRIFAENLDAFLRHTATVQK